MKRSRRVVGCIWLLALPAEVAAGPPGVGWDLTFDRPERAMAGAGSSVRADCDGQLAIRGLEAGERGPAAWSVSISSEGCSIIDVTTAGTVGASVDDDPPGLRDQGFEKTELTRGPGNEGAVSAVFLSFVRSVTLPPEGSDRQDGESDELEEEAFPEGHGDGPPSTGSRLRGVTVSDFRGPPSRAVSQVPLSMLHLGHE